MKRTITKILLIFSFLLVFNGFIQGRLRFIGPDPYFSFRTFPQDLRLLGSNLTLIYFTLGRRGWMGNLDVPEASPSPSYIATEEVISEDLGSTIAEASFKGTWISPSLIAVPFALEVSTFKIYPIISSQFDFFSLRSSGAAIGREEERSFLIPFSSELKQRNWSTSFGFLLSGEFGDIPFGFILNYTRFSEGQPSGFLEYTMEGRKISLNRFNWGWSTVVGCNHIFGVRSNIDAFWQDRYNQTTLSQLDLVFGADLGENKIGLRIRRIQGHQTYYEYDERVDFYREESIGNNVGKTLIRNYNVLKVSDLTEKSKLFVVLVGEVDFVRNPFTKGDTVLLDSYREDTFGAEILPFLHFDLPAGGFFRIGSSVSLFRTNYRYIDVWGGQEVYSPGWAAFDWEPWWERSSYGHWWKFTVFSEADLEVVLIRQPRLLLLMDMWTHHNFVWTSRFYGKPEPSGEGYSFRVEAERRNFLKELWMGGTFGLMFGDDFKIGIFMDFPIYYDNYRTTEIEGEGGNYFKGISDAQPRVRKPVQVWVLFSLTR